MKKKIGKKKKEMNSLYKWLMLVVSNISKARPKGRAADLLGKQMAKSFFIVVKLNVYYSKLHLRITVSKIKVY